MHIGTQVPVPTFRGLLRSAGLTGVMTAARRLRGPRKAGTGTCASLRSQSRMALPPEATFISIVTFHAHGRKAFRMADASVHGDARKAVILYDIRNLQDKLGQNMEETITTSE